MSQATTDQVIRSFLAVNAMLREEVALVRRALARRSEERKYNPNWPSQPRAPSGVPEGGQWVDGGGGAKQAAPRQAPAMQRTRPGQLTAPTPGGSGNRVRVPLTLLLRGNPLSLALPLTGDTPQPVRSARIVPGTDDLVLVLVRHRQTNQVFASFERIVRAERRVPLVVFGVDTGLATTEPAELERLNVEVVVDRDDVLFDPRVLARAYGREVPGVTSAAGGDPPALTPGFGIVTESEEEADLAARMRAAGSSEAQIQAAIDTIRVNRREAANSGVIRREPGVAYNSRPLAVGGAHWLRGTGGNVARIPEQVAARLRGRTFKNARAFRRALWLAFAEEPGLAVQFPPDPENSLQRGLAPPVLPSQRHGRQARYIVHHDVRVADDPSRQYDMSSMLIVTPLLHLDIIGRSAHFGPRRPTERKAAMSREELIRIVKHIFFIDQYFRETDPDDDEAEALEEEERTLFYTLEEALPHSWISQRIRTEVDATAEELIDEALQLERALSEGKCDSFVPRTLREIIAFSHEMRHIAPSFVDRARPYRTIDTEFYGLNESLRRLRSEFGEEMYQRLLALSKNARAHYEADPEGETEHVTAGHSLLRELEDIMWELRMK